MECPSCGHPSSSGASYCGKCGTRLAAVLACPACGTPHRVGQRFCEACGRRLSEPDTSAAPASARRYRRRPANVPATFGGGRFRVQRLLGEGGRKRVFLARDELLDREVACAVIRTEGLDEAERLRVEREAQAMALLGEHPHVVTVFDIGEEGGEPYIVSQYMAGGDLRGLLSAAPEGRLPLDRAVRIADEVCQALEHVHAHGFVHRDLKPGNIWFTADGTAEARRFRRDDGVRSVAADRDRHGRRDGGLHGARAGARDGRRRALRPLRAGRDPVRDSHRAAAVRRRYQPGRDHAAHRDGAGRSALAQPASCRARSRGSSCGCWQRCPRSARRARPPCAAHWRRSLQRRPAPPIGERSRQLSPLDRLESGVFVGREREQRELRAGLDEASVGTGPTDAAGR